MAEFDDRAEMFQLAGVPYLDFFATLHAQLMPRTYLEVGTATGASLTSVLCDTISVDPQFALGPGATGRRTRTFFFQMPSDTFFATQSVTGLLGRPVDVAFLDGLHRFEFLLRDLINTEAVCHPRSLIVLHDCLPLNTRMALRQFKQGDPERETNIDFWTGDVWKLLPILDEYRPDLRIHILDCPPTGLVAITRVDPESHVLSDRYYDIVDQYAGTVMDNERLSSFWDGLKLTPSQPLCQETDRLTELFSLY